MAKSKDTGINIPRTTRPPITSEGRDNEMINLAYDLVEQRLRNGTASSQETTHFLKLATEKAQLELEMAKEQKKLIQAKTEALQSAKEIEALYSEAIAAMQAYRGE
jgi:hypothetical protein